MPPASLKGPCTAPAIKPEARRARREEAGPGTRPAALLLQLPGMTQRNATEPSWLPSGPNSGSSCRAALTTVLLRKRRSATHGFSVQMASHLPRRFKMWPWTTVARTRLRPAPASGTHRCPRRCPRACPGLSSDRLTPAQWKTARASGAFPRLATLSQAHGAEEVVPTCGAVGEAGPTRIPVSPCPHVPVSPHRQYSRSRLSVRGVPGARPCLGGPEERNKGKKFHSVLRSMPLWDLMPSPGWGGDHFRENSCNNLSQHLCVTS